MLTAINVFVLLESYMISEHIRYIESRRLVSSVTSECRSFLILWTKWRQLENAFVTFV